MHNIVSKLPLIIGFLVWISVAIYFLFEVKKKIKLLAAKNEVNVVFECTNCKNTEEYTYSDYMGIVKEPRNKSQNFSSTQNQYFFNCKKCNSKHFQNLLYEKIPENSNFIKERRKIILIFLLKEFALAILIMAILGFSGVLPK